jgi:two-component system sensor histidine kinase RpfC
VVATALREIEGVNVVTRDASPRHVHNAIHAATSKAGIGKVIDLRAVLEEKRQKLRILVAEDNLTNQQIIRELLERAGHQVLLASDGEIALDMYEEQQPHLAILDFNMPHRNGLEVTKMIRAMEGVGVRIPIMILSASVTAEARERARRAGADEFVGKPYEAATLLHTIDRMARRRASAHGEGQPTSVHAEVHAIAGKGIPLVDMQRLADVQRIAGNSDFMSRLIAGFDGDVTRLLTELDDVLGAGALAQVADVTHAMKGAALGIGAARLAGLCAQLEQAARNGDATAANLLHAQLRGTYEQTSAELHRSGPTPLRAATH